MKQIALLFSRFFIIALMSLTGCYLTFEAAKVETIDLQPLKNYPVQAKVYQTNEDTFIQSGDLMTSYSAFSIARVNIYDVLQQDDEQLNELLNYINKPKLKNFNGD